MTRAGKQDPRKRALKRLKGLAETMRNYQARADCPFPRSLLVFGAAALTEMHRRGVTAEEFSQTHLAEFPEHVIPNAFYYYSFYGVYFWTARRRIAEILNLEDLYEAALDEQRMQVRRVSEHLANLSLTCIEGAA